MVDVMRQDLLALEGRRRLYTGLSVVLLIAVVAAGYREASALNSGGFLQGLLKFFDYPSQIVMQAWDQGWEFWSLFPKFLPALIETINIAAVATIIGAVFATVLSLASSRNLEVPAAIIPVVRRIMDIMRAFPELIIALFLIFVLGASPVPAAIAVAFHTSGALGKLFSEVNENIDVKPLEGLKATGSNWLQRVRFGVIPQVLPNYSSYFLLRFEINVRASAILGFVGAGGIGTELSRAIGWGAGSEVAALFLMLFLSIVAIDQLSSYLRRHFVGAENFS
ncbi:phosphonate ABC transporter, permease protein PhnE [Nisaea acidiphila]|uniref:Phosphonate ABC transporter, permease protein PhnE n=1 Tax=Nisaea acidiphila TaxID=1862145 RepID=A0A9J7AU02_9PROT|nr:phosphonate ABC transporter, permease protein PhnE [Nisaea acidiphila]UUX48861.1 phosphonate ABC transporter, permease protein PhnE [Nisaea acidiphila]